MNKTRKLFAILLAAVMMLAMCTTAFAGQEGTLTGGTITIEDAVPGQTYNAYQILYLESYSTDAEGKPTGAYAYKANSAWEDWLKTQDSYVSIDDQGYVTWVNVKDDDGKDVPADAAAFAKAAQAYATTMVPVDPANPENTSTTPQISPDASQTAGPAADGKTYSTVTFSNLKLGYYLIDTSLGTLCSLDTTNPAVTIEEKNEVPSNEKKVQEDSTNAYGSVNDADIGDTVTFKSTITLPKGSENIVFHDMMSSGLTLNTTRINVYTDANMTTELAANNYTVITTGLKDSCTFEISFKQTYLNGLTADSTTVYVKYTATVNQNAVVGGNGNTNTSKVSYGDENNTKTTPGSTTTTYTWSFDVLKYANGDITKVLKDAQFVLLNSDKSKVATIVNGKLTSWTNVPDAGQDGTITWPANTTLTTDANGKIAIEGLDTDTYYLREIAAPAGYNKLADDVKVEIKPTTASDGKSMTLTPVTAAIENKSGAELPSTGGMGTTIFYVLGGVLVVIAVVLLITKKRMDAEKRESQNP